MIITALILVEWLMESLLFLFVLGLWPIGAAMLVLVAVLSYGLHGLYNHKPEVRTNLPPIVFCFNRKSRFSHIMHHLRNESSHHPPQLDHQGQIRLDRCAREIACVYRGRGASRE